MDNIYIKAYDINRTNMTYIPLTAITSLYGINDNSSVIAANGIMYVVDINIDKLIKSFNGVTISANHRRKKSKKKISRTAFNKRRELRKGIIAHMWCNKMLRKNSNANIS